MRTNTLSGRVLIGVVAIIALLAGAVFAQAIVERRNVGDVMAGYFVSPPQALFHKDRIALVLLGIDYDYNSKDEEYSTNARTDTIMAASLDFPAPGDPSGHVAILSVPRDTDVVLPSGREDKINAAYAVGGSPLADGHASEKVIAQFLGLRGFDRFVTLRINAAKELVDAIGGIDVIPDETMNYDDSWGHLHIHFIGGRTYHMNGEQAVSYSRFRHDECSDPCRIKRQDQVIRLAIAKLKNDRLNDLLHVNALIGVVRRNVYTDLDTREMLSLAWAFQHIDLAKLDAQQIPYVGEKTLDCCGSVLIADDEAKRRFAKRMFLDPVTPQSVPDAAAVAAVDPARIHVDVENGSGVSGAGAKLADSLRKHGFVIAGIANASSFAHDSTEIHVHATAAPLAGERIRNALALATASVEPDGSAAAGQGSDVTVIVGRDFVQRAQNAQHVTSSR